MKITAARVETDEGLVSCGGACPACDLTGDTPWRGQDAIAEDLGPAVMGAEPFRLEAIPHRCERELWTVGDRAACAAPEMALRDLKGKALGRPLCDLVGGRTRDDLREVTAWGWDESDALAEKSRRMFVEGVSVFGVGVGDLPKCDEQRARGW